MPVSHCMFSAGRCVFWCPLAGAESDFCGRNGRWKGLIFRHNRVLVQNQGTVLKKSSRCGVHPGHFPSREGENERRPISCAHSSWIKRSTLLCRFPKREQKKKVWQHTPPTPPTLGQVSPINVSLGTFHEQSFMNALHSTPQYCLKKNQNAPRPSEHPPVMGEKCQNV